eukprot:PhM_4_TR8264/c0_g1_i1/m.106500
MKRLREDSSPAPNNNKTNGLHTTTSTSAHQIRSAKKVAAPAPTATTTTAVVAASSGTPFTEDALRQHNVRMACEPQDSAENRIAAWVCEVATALTTRIHDSALTLLQDSFRWTATQEGVGQLRTLAERSHTQPEVLLSAIQLELSRRPLETRLPIWYAVDALLKLSPLNIYKEMRAQLSERVVVWAEHYFPKRGEQTAKECASMVSTWRRCVSPTLFDRCTALVSQ